MVGNGKLTHNDKKCPEISTGNAHNTTQFIWPICPNWPIIWNLKVFNPHHMSVVHDQEGATNSNSLCPIPSCTLQSSCTQLSMFQILSQKHKPTSKNIFPILFSPFTQLFYFIQPLSTQT